MPKSDLFVVSDLHLADMSSVLEGYAPRQQTALEGLLAALLPTGALGATAPHLVINGDCFDFLALTPYPTDGLSTASLALEKLEKIARAHQPFFQTLRAFLDQGGRVTFLIGNHDIELCFAEVRERVVELIDPGGTRSERLRFCLDRFYQPVPDVWIEHGNQYDFWNYTGELWDQHGKALTSNPARVVLPLGTQYTQLASLPQVLRYPYFDRFAPPLGITRQLALLCLLDPALTIQVAQGVADMMSRPYQPLRDLSAGGEQRPAELFSHAITDFMAFQEDMLARTPAWPDIEAYLYSAEEREHNQSAIAGEFFTLLQALSQDQETALQAIFAPLTNQGDEDTTRGMQHILRTRPELRVAIAGHTHALHADRAVSPSQLYLNTATWIQRLAPPIASDLSPALLDWLRNPDLDAHPLTEKTAFAFAHVSIETGQPSRARLCAWQGGRDGCYHELESEKE